MFDSLKSVPRTGNWGVGNKKLDAEVERLKSAHPNLFLQDHELKYRKFYHEPASVVPMSSYVIPRP
jgi:hypothetical protein